MGRRSFLQHSPYQLCWLGLCSPAPLPSLSPIHASLQVIALGGPHTSQCLLHLIVCAVTISGGSCVPVTQVVQFTVAFLDLLLTPVLLTFPSFRLAPHLQPLAFPCAP